MCHAHLFYSESRSPSLATCPGCHVCVCVCLNVWALRSLPSSRWGGISLFNGTVPARALCRYGSSFWDSQTPNGGSEVNTIWSSFRKSVKTIISLSWLGREMVPTLGAGYLGSERLVLRFQNRASRRSSNWEEENPPLSYVSAEHALFLISSA